MFSLSESEMEILVPRRRVLVPTAEDQLDEVVTEGDLFRVVEAIIDP